MSFKVGDKVRYVKTGCLGWESEDWTLATKPPLVLREEYTVRSVDIDGDVALREDSLDLILHRDHFALVTESPCAECSSLRPGSVISTDGDFRCAACGRFVSTPAGVIGLPTEAVGVWLNSLSSDARKEVAVARGLFAYFPDALALVARHSVRSNEKHNPGQPVHWSREKSSDHEDCIARHSLSVAVNPDALDGDAPHIICRAWRALAALQVWVEAKHLKGETV